jgi:hypothetical protein
MAQDDNINTPMVAVAGVIASVVVFLIIVLLQVLFFSMSEAEMARKDNGAPSEPLVDLLTSQRAELDSYHWVDQKKGVVAIPISRAMELALSSDRAARVAPAPAVPAPGAPVGTPAAPPSSATPVKAATAPAAASTPAPAAPATKAEAKKDGH